MKPLIFITFLIVTTTNLAFSQNWSIDKTEIVWEHTYETNIENPSTLKNCILNGIDSLPEFTLKSTNENKIMADFEKLKFYFGKYGFSFKDAPSSFSSGFTGGIMEVHFENGSYTVKIYSLSTLVVKTGSHYNSSYNYLYDKSKRWENVFLRGSEVKNEKYENALKITDLNFLDMFKFGCPKQVKL